jgi:hypothetical protein
MQRFLSWCVPSIMVLTAGCRARESTGAGTTVDTLPSGTVVVHNRGSGSWDSAQAWKVVLGARISSGDSDGAIAFKWITNIQADRRGHVYLSDGDRSLIHVFDSAGRFVRDIGRQGKGPGEFNTMDDLFWDTHDRLVALDHTLRRASLFDTSGRVLATHDERPINFAGYGWRGAITPAGEVLRPEFDRAWRELHWMITRFDTLYNVVDTGRIRIPWGKDHTSTPKVA